jgi:hypothetical protein
VSKQNSGEILMGTIVKRALFGSVLAVLTLFGVYFFAHKNFAPLTGQLQSLRGESSVKDGFYDLKIVGFDKNTGEKLFADDYKDVQVKNAAYALNLNLPRKVSDSVLLQVCRSKQGTEQRDGSVGESEQTCTKDPRDGIEVVECAKTADISEGSGLVSRVLGIKEARVSIRCIDGATEKSIAAVEQSNTTVLGAEAVSGLPGQQGAKGDKGDVGATGLQGAPGLTGQQGPAGNPATDDQTLSYLSGTQILSITGGNSISLSSLLDNTDVLASLSCSAGQVAQWSGLVWQCASAAVDTDQQTLLVTGAGLARQLQITNGNTVNIPDANTDAQTLSLATNMLSISGGNTVNLATYLDNTDAQNLAFNTGTQILSIGGGNTVNLSSLLDNTDAQSISRSGNTLSISGNASTVDLSTYLDNTDILASLSCATSQIARWNGTIWICSNDIDTNTTYTNGTGIGLTGTVFSNTGVLSTTSGTGLSNSGTAQNPTLNLTNTGVTTGTYNNVTVDAQGRATAGSNIAYLTTETDGVIGNEILDVTTNSGLVRSGTGTTLDPYKVGLITSCTANQLLKYVVSVWTCANDTDTDTTYTQGTGITIVGNVISANALGTGVVTTTNILDGTILAADLSTGSVTSTSILDGTIVSADLAAGAVTNANLANSSLTVSPGNGLSGGGSVALGGTTTLAINAPTCTGTQKLSWNGTAFLCTADQDTTYTNGTGISLTGNVFANTGVLSTGVTTGLANTGTATAPILGLTNTGITAGTYNNVTVDAQGRATGGSNVAYLSTEVDGMIGNEVFEITAGSGVSLTGTKAAGYTVTASLGVDIISSEIVDGTIVNADLAAGSVTSSNILDGTIVTADIANQAITNALIAADAVGSAEIIDGSILFADISANSCINGQVVGFDGTNWYCRGLQYYAESTNTPATAPQAISGNSVAIGDGASADGTNAYAIGNATTIISQEGIAIGYNNAVKNDGIVALGVKNAVNNANGIAVGRDNTIDGKESVALGISNTDKGYDNVYLIGRDLLGSKSNQVVLGTNDATKVIIDDIGRITFNGAFAPGGNDGVGGQVLISQGAGAIPVWVDVGGLLSAGAGIGISGNTITSTLGVSIDTSEIVDGTIALADLASNSVNSSKVVDGTIVLADLAGNSVDASKIVDGTVANADLVNSSLTVTAGTGLSGGGSVSLGGTVTISSTLGTDIVSSEIANGTIAAADIAADALDFTELGDALTLDAATSIALGANNLTTNLNSTGNFIVQDNGTAFMTIDNAGAYSFTLDAVDNPAYTITNAGTSNVVTNLSGTGDFIIQDSGVAVLSVLDNGTFLFKNSANSTTSFAVQNFAATNLFVIDTTNSRAYIGDPLADATGALLVLDTKNTAGDPVGVNGGQYYNSSKGKFRCYEVNVWTDCGEQQSRGAFNYQNEMLGVPTTTDQNIASVVAGGGANNAATVNSVAAHPGIVQSTTSVAVNGRSALMTNAVSTILLGGNVEYVYETELRIPVLSTVAETYIYRTGFMDLATGDSTDGCYFRYSDAINGARWQGVCRSNTTESICDVLSTVNINQWYRLTVDVNPAGTSTDFQVDGVSRCQITTNIPTGVGRGTGFGSNVIKTLGPVANYGIDIDYIQVLGRFATPR